MLKVRTNPGGASTDGSGEGGHILGRLGANQCVIGLATSGDWLQVRYGQYEAAWTLLSYRGRTMLAPLSEAHPGVFSDVEDEDGTSVRGKPTNQSPFPMPREVLGRNQIMK